MIWYFVTADPVLTNNQRRREQNRAAQRAFRERKDKEIHSLRNKLAEIKALNEELSRAEQLETDLARLQRNNEVLELLMESINPQCTHPCQGYPVPTARPGWIQGHKLEEDIICPFIRIAEITLL